MLKLDLDQSSFDRIKRALRDALPDIQSAHRTEAAARALGFGSNAALRTALADGTATVPVRPDVFDAYLRSKGCRFVWSEFAAACAAEAIRAVSAREPTLAVGGFLPRNLGSSPHRESFSEDDLSLLAYAPNSLLEPIAVEGFVAAWRHLSEPYRQAALAGERDAGVLTRLIATSERLDIRPGTVVAVAVHMGFAVRREPHPSSATTIDVPRPAGTDIRSEAWIARAIDESEPMKEDGRRRLREGYEAGRFDAGAAEDVIKALWARAFVVRLQVPGIPGWQAYGRMLLADDELFAFGLSRRDPDALMLVRAGIEGLCGGGPLPGVAPGYTHVFEGDLGRLLNARRAA